MIIADEETIKRAKISASQPHPMQAKCNVQEGTLWTLLLEVIHTAGTGIYTGIDGASLPWIYVELARVVHACFQQSSI